MNKLSVNYLNDKQFDKCYQILEKSKHMIENGFGQSQLQLVLVCNNISILM